MPFQRELPNMTRAVPVTGIAIAALTIAVHAGDKTPMQAVPVSTAKSILSIYVLEGWVWNPRGPQLVLAAWDNGRVIWSENRVTGGAPYWTSQIDQKRITELFTRICNEGFFDERELNCLRVPYDSGSTVLLARTGKKQIRMRSAHETYPNDGHLSFRSKSPAGRWQNATGNDARYFGAWDELRRTLNSVIPTNGTQIDGKLFHEGGEVFWIESSELPSSTAEK